MTISVETVRYVYEGPYDVDDNIPIPFSYGETDHVKVLEGTTPLALNVDYTVLGQNVTIKKAIAEGTTITVYRNTPLDNGAEFPQEAPFDSEKINNAIDKLTRQNQEQQEELSRALKLSLDAPTSLKDLVLPIPDPNKSLKWNESGTALINTEFDPDIALEITKQYRDEAEASAQAAKTSETNAKTSETNAKTSETNAKTSETNAKDWATKMDGMVNNEDYSAKYYANEAKVLTAGSLNQKQITNCILSAQNPNITNNSVSDASYVNTGCTVSEAGVASGFSADNRILLSKTMSSATASTLEIPFTTGSNVNADQTLVYINNFSNSLGISGGKIALRYDGNVMTGTTTLAASTAYVALLTRTANNYTVQVKPASGAYGDAEITLTSTAGYFGGKSVYLGGGDTNYFQGTIDLANVVITADSADYWRITTLSDFQTVTVSGTYQLLMPDGRNSDRTMKNVTSTITLNDTLLYSPVNGEKTLLVKEDGEVMIRDTYAESYNEPADFATGGVFFNKTENTLNEQLSTYPNFLNFVSFVGAKIGNITDNGTTITSMTIDMPLTLVKDTDVVHNTGDENIEGSKTFEDIQYFENLIETTGQGLLVKHESLNSRDNQYPYIHLNNPHAAVDIEEENLAAGQSFGRFAMVDTTGKIIGGMSLTTATNAAINTPTLAVETSRFYNGERQSSNLKLSFNAKGETTFEFPRCTSRPSTTSTAANNRVAVVVANYRNGNSGYTVYSDGLIVQWGQNKPANQSGTVTLLRAFSTSNYSLQLTPVQSSAAYYSASTVNTKATNSFTYKSYNTNTTAWLAVGY